MTLQYKVEISNRDIGLHIGNAGSKTQMEILVAMTATIEKEVYPNDWFIQCHHIIEHMGKRKSARVLKILEPLVEHLKEKAT